MGGSKKEKLEYAKLLFLEGKLSQKEIALRCKVSENTVSKWVNQYNWKDLRVSLITLKDNQLKRLYGQLEKMTTYIDENKDNLPTAKDVDAQVKLVTAIKKLESESNVGEIMEVARRFCMFVKEFDLPFAQQAAEYFDQFIQANWK